MPFDPEALSEEMLLIEDDGKEFPLILWNDLPLPIGQASSLLVFKSLLKTHLFSLAFDT